VFLTSFRVGEDEKEALLDALLPLLPSGVHENGDVLSVFSAVPFERSLMEGAVGRVLQGWTVEEVPADWRSRRALLGGGGVVIGGRVSIRSPWNAPPSEADVVDVVVERRGSAFGSGSHPTTQMCVALLLELEPSGGAADLGCGVGTLAIVAAKLGWEPVVAVDRVPVAIEVATENTPEVRHVIVSGIVAEEVEAVLAGYHAVGFDAAAALGTEDEWIALRLSC
jgi:ribosomal protein L11 methyltransferase